ncbi:DUF1826 domain-containing protein [Maricaulis sp.]|uniref:DUF1826 domain-containing protein n=1 Tax=Maricaulis sp. TaxID=1486257 RepID=UPI00261E9D49|nr:DUF1826 domain-containing protein [Maricaulis sp.]
MNLIAQNAFNADLGTPIRRVQHLSGLTALANPGAEAVIWDRPIPPAMARALEGWPKAKAADIRLVLNLSEIEAAAVRVFNTWGGLEPMARDWLAKDIAGLATQLAQTLAASRVHLRFEHVRDDACRRFHKDNVRARLICTYRGPGTQFGYTERLADEPARFDTVATGSPIFLRGKTWPSSQVGHVVHRSPPVQADGVSRLVIVIDEAKPELPHGLQTR